MQGILSQRLRVCQEACDGQRGRTVPAQKAVQEKQMAFADKLGVSYNCSWRHAGQCSLPSPRKGCRAMRCSLLHPMSPGAPGVHVAQLIMVLGNPPQQLHSGGPALTSAGAATQALRWALALLTGGGWRLMHAICSRCLAGRSTWIGVPPTAPGAPMPGCEAMQTHVECSAIDCRI